MKARHGRWRCAAASLAFAAAFPAHGQDRPAGYPSKPIRLVLSAAPGAGADIITRAVGQMISEKFGQQVVVDNRAGAGGVISMDLVARAAPDGYTFLSQGDSLLLQGAAKRVSYDVRRAFDAVVPTSAQPYILMSHLTLPVRSIKDLVAYSHTSQVSYSGSSGIGAAVHLGMEHFAQISGARLLFVPYKGSAPAIIALMGGEIQVAAASAIAASGAIRSGKVRALANLGSTRIPAMPDLPTVAEQGYPDFKIANRYGLYAPAGTPKAILLAINKVVTEGMNAPAMAQKLQADGSQPAERMTPDEYRAVMLKEYAEFEVQVKRLNL